MDVGRRQRDVLRTLVLTIHDQLAQVNFVEADQVQDVILYQVSCVQREYLPLLGSRVLRGSQPVISCLQAS